MYLLHIFCTISCILSIFSIASACKGCVNLDQYNFEKFIPKYDVVLAKFDENYPHGEKHDIFTALADELVDNNRIILAEVPIRHSSVRKNKEFGMSHGILTMKDLPTLKLFVKGKDEPFVFEKNMAWSVENLKTFIRNHTRIYWNLPGCLETFDKLANDFITLNEREAVLKRAEAEANKFLTERQKNIANVYIEIMKEIMESGFPFVFEEQYKLEKELKELSHRLNVIKLFTLYDSD